MGGGREKRVEKKNVEWKEPEAAILILHSFFFPSYFPCTVDFIHVTRG